MRSRALSAKFTNDQRKLMLTALAFVQSREAAGAMIEIANTKDFPFTDLAKWWLFNRKGNDWMHYDVEAGMKALGLYDPEKVKLVAVEMPAEPKGVPKLPPVADILKLRGDAKRGQTAVALCQTCHKIGAAAVDFGPELTTFGQQQPAEVIVNAIANPSAEIAHGFEGSEVKTKDGLAITGMVLSSGDPLIIKCMGGLVQTVPRSRIKSNTWSAVCESRLAVGSSAMIRLGRLIKARAMATRWRWPPESASGKCWACSCSPTAFSCAVTRSRLSAAGTPVRNRG